MTTILFAFAAACLFALAATPWAGRAAFFFDLLDRPSSRKMHAKAMPRTGGVAIFPAFLFPFGLLLLLRQHSLAAQSFFADERLPTFFAGAALIFLFGLLDDIRGLSFQSKFSGQILTAVLVYWGGLQISAVTVPCAGSVSLGIFSLPATVFWFVLVINAINLADGLDGLAAGICLFASLAMLFVCAVSSRPATALAFAALAGALTGFLRYNFHPASIFMGDSGSHFLGYCLAALSIADSVKGQVATALLLPVIALGVPLIDTICTPFRRFLAGQHIFQPDQAHFHHRLISMGYTHRRAVLLIYSLTIFLAGCAILLVHVQNDLAGLILFTLGGGLIGITHSLGPADLLNIRSLSAWARDLSDEAGIRYDRRLFLSHQFRIAQAADPDGLWAAVCEALAMLRFDAAELLLTQNQRQFVWNSGAAAKSCDRDAQLRIELPLHGGTGQEQRKLGSLLLVKEMRNAAEEAYILKRIEQLRRSIIAALLKMSV